MIVAKMVSMRRKIWEAIGGRSAKGVGNMEGGVGLK